MSAATDFGQLVQLIQAARGLEAGGYYGLAKLLWALAYSAEIKASNTAGIPRGAALDMSILNIINNLKASTASILPQFGEFESNDPGLCRFIF